MVKLYFKLQVLALLVLLAPRANGTAELVDDTPLSFSAETGPAFGGNSNSFYFDTAVCLQGLLDLTFAHLAGQDEYGDRLNLLSFGAALFPIKPSYDYPYSLAVTGGLQRGHNLNMGHKGYWFGSKFSTIFKDTEKFVLIHRLVLQYTSADITYAYSPIPDVEFTSNRDLISGSLSLILGYKTRDKGIAYLLPLFRIDDKVRQFGIGIGYMYKTSFFTETYPRSLHRE